MHFKDQTKAVGERTVAMNRNRKLNVFIVGLDDFNRKELDTIHNRQNYNFHCLLEPDEVLKLENYSIEDKLAKAQRILSGFDGQIDGLFTHWDFPSSVLTAVLCREFGLRGASVDSVLKCEHKYWSRLEQKKAASECVPKFCMVDPFDPEALAKINLDYPFWIKPVKAYSSILGFKINNKREFEQAMEITRKKIRRFGEPLEYLMRFANAPEEIVSAGGSVCIAEEYVDGMEVAPEGYVFEGQIGVHGVVDLIRGPNGKSFERLDYPSRAPLEVQERIIKVTKKVIAQVGLENQCFNVEYFWDAKQDKLWLLEINPRISQTHANLFEKVDGVSNHEVAVQVATGQEPRFEHGAGKYQHASQFMIRRYEDGIVRKTPGKEDVQRMLKEVPDTYMNLGVREGDRLSKLKDQDIYSFDLADLFIGGQSERELKENYQRCLDLLPFEIEPVGNRENEKRSGSAGS